MVDEGKAQIERLITGVPALDDILHGGFPSGTLNIITGGPGAGKSLLGLQILFQKAHLGRKVIYFTTIAEPALKFLRFMQQFEFFDPKLINKTFFFTDLSGPAFSKGLEETIDVMKRQVADIEPAVVAIDSFKALQSRLPPLPPTPGARQLLYQLVVDLAVSGVTAFLAGEYDESDIVHLSEFYAADSIIALSRRTVGLRVSRQLEVLKLRGSGYEPGLHFFDISSRGITVYPRVSIPTEEEPAKQSEARLSTGVPGLDRMLGGGLPELNSTILEGGTGTGKTTLALSFLIEGARKGEPGLFVTLDETRSQLIKLASGRGWDLQSLIGQGLLEIVYVSPLNFVADALLQQAKELITRLGAKRIVIDSLSALNLSIAAEGRSQELVYALVKTFRGMGVTSIMTNEIPQLLGAPELSGHGLSSLADNIIVLRYVESNSRLARGVSVLKVRGSAHDDTLRELTIGAERVEVGEPFLGYGGVLTGIPTPMESEKSPRRHGRSGPSGSKTGESPSPSR